MFYARYDSPLGAILLMADEEGLTGLWFVGQRDCPEPGWADSAAETPALVAARRWLDAYFSGREPEEEPPLRLTGTPFQQEVWALLRQIPYGQTVSYGELARRLTAQGSRARTSARAIGGAVKRNPVSLIVPCHRVIGADGSLTGYAGGVERKRELLALEGATLG